MSRYDIEHISKSSDEWVLASIWGDHEIICAVIDNEARHPRDRIICYALRSAAARIASALNRVSE